jgi:hypothetical protein
MSEDTSILDAPQIDPNQSIIQDEPIQINNEPKERKPRKKRVTKKQKEKEQTKSQQNQTTKLIIQLMKVKFEEKLKDIDISKLDSLNDDELLLLKETCKLRLTSGSNVDITVNSVLMSIQMIEKTCVNYGIHLEGFTQNIKNNQQINDDLTLLAIELIDKFNIDYRYRLAYNILRTGLATKEINEHILRQQQNQSIIIPENQQ